MLDGPLLSIVIPCHNSEKWLDQLLASIFGVERHSVEVILVDDGSTDGSVSVARCYQHMKILRQSRHGAAFARNYGLSEATGLYVNFMDADDFVESSALDQILVSLPKRPASVVVTRYWDLMQDGAVYARTLTPWPTNKRAYISSWICGKGLPGPCLFINRELCNRLGGWNPSLNLLDDLEFSIRMLFHTESITALDCAYFYYRQHNGEDRISRGNGVEELTSAVTVYRCILEMMQDQLTVEERRHLSREIYSLARRLFSIEEDLLGMAACELVSVCSRSNPGQSIAERLGVALLGPARFGLLRARLARRRSRGLR